MSMDGLGNDRLYRALEREVKRLEEAWVIGEVDAIEGDRASLKLADSPPGTAWIIPPELLVLVGDLVFAYRRGGLRQIRGVLNRNALNAMALNPFTGPHQVLMSDADGNPTVLAAPADPELDYVLEWDGETEAPVWRVKP